MNRNGPGGHTPKTIAKTSVYFILRLCPHAPAGNFGRMIPLPWIYGSMTQEGIAFLISDSEKARVKPRRINRKFCHKICKEQLPPRL